jgi:hypothetical protein
MTSFAHTSYPSVHPGVQRAIRVFGNIKNLVLRADSARGVAIILLSAIVSTVLVIVNQVIDTYTDGHLMAAWMFMWLVAFSTIALLAAPIRRSVNGFKPAFRSWLTARRERANDERMWEVALQDPRVMAEIQRAVSHN